MAIKRDKDPRDEMIEMDDAATDDAARKANLIKAGIGIGSAALVAALLYANHARNKKKADRATAVRDDD
jgi:hypothetical protein